MSDKTSAISIYLSEIRKDIADGNATEHTHRPALKALLEIIGKDITATNEPKRIICGSPDFQITRKTIPLGHVETKDIATNLDEMERGKGPHGEQFIRYRDGLPNWILTDYLQFRWIVNGEKRLTVSIAELDAKGKVKPLPDGEEKLEQLLTAFLKQEALTIGTARDLARRMAGMTRIIRDLIVNTFDHEKEQGWLHNWLSAFRETLIPDLDEKQFADMFAQTLAYGLFAARVHTPPNKEFSREMAAYNLPKTNPFLRKLFAEIAGVDMPDSIAWAVDDIVELLKHADMSEILKDFGKGKGKEDPVVHFYETFLAAYDPKMREVRGVYYTPEPVVSYIVRSIDYLLKTRFDRPKGLADENTLILDPATGTATFLYFVIDQIHQGFAKQAGAWDDYVAKHLLNRIFGFELLMAPYAVAHLKLGMQLQETGYKFGSDQRLGVYMTNTLEHTAKQTQMRYAEFLAKEATEASAIKDVPVLEIVLGNPPYSGHSANRSRDDGGKLTFIGELMQDYYAVDGQPLGERNPKWLQDDYVKFIRFAQWRIEKTGHGILGFITNHGYLDNPTFRGMRQSLLNTFDEIHLLDLHGNSKRQERAPDGGEDKNVFDIQQGVAILLAVKTAKRADDEEKRPARVFHADLWGKREIYGGDQLSGGKYHWLWQNSAETTPWQELNPSSPSYLFRPQDMEMRTEYEEFWKVTALLPVNVLGFQTHRDHFAIDFDEAELRRRIGELREKRLSDDEIRSKYDVSDNRDWKLRETRSVLGNTARWEDAFINCLYRPFDFRPCYFNQIAMDYPRHELIEHVFRRENLCLLVPRQISLLPWQHVWASRLVAESCVISAKTKEQNYCFPLYLYPATDELDTSTGRRPNLAPAFIAELVKKLGIPFRADDGQHTTDSGPRTVITPEDIFYYAYAVFFSPTYRTRYADFLKIDFPRLPLTSDASLFRDLASKGAELAALHLMESPKLETFITDWPVKGDNVVDKVQYTDKGRRVWINKTQYFGGVPKEVWEFHVGGHQVSVKWLKDRKGRSLSYDDIMHYQRVVVALKETIELMQEIDEIINGHSGWPGAFLVSEVKSPSGPATQDSSGLNKAAEDGFPYGNDEK